MQLYAPTTKDSYTYFQTNVDKNMTITITNSKYCMQCLRLTSVQANITVFTILEATLRQMSPVHLDQNQVILQCCDPQKQSPENSDDSTVTTTASSSTVHIPQLT